MARSSLVGRVDFEHSCGEFVLMEDDRRELASIISMHRCKGECLAVLIP